MLTLLRIAVRNLTRQRRRTALVLVAIAIGVTAVTGVRGFMNALQDSLVSAVVEGGVGAIQVHAAGYLQNTDVAALTPNLDAGDALLNRITAIEGVKAAAPRLSFPAMVAVGDDSVFAMVVAVDPVREAAVCKRRTESVQGGAWLEDKPQSLAGMELLHGVGGTVGQRLTLLGNDADGVMNAVDTTLVGQLAAVTGGEKKLVLVPLSVGQGLVRMPGRATEIAVGVVDRKRVDDVTARLRTALGAGFEVTPWTELAPFARDAVMEQDLALNIITAVFLVVILLGVANAMLTSVLERVREIGTMMAVGTTRRQVLTLFTLEAAMLGILGGVLGCLVGSAVVAVLALHGVTLTTPGASLPQHLVPFIELSFLVKMVVLCGVGASFAALWPAWKASRLHPASALASV